MAKPIFRVYFDFVDPLSYLALHILASGDLLTPNAQVEWIGFELRPPPAPLTSTTDPIWASRREAAQTRAGGLGLRLAPPTLVPWTRKAHELHVFAASRGLADAVRLAVFEAFFRESRDIGRVDVLVDIAVEHGLDRTEVKAVLDVDRHEADVASARREALETGVNDVPCYFVAGQVVRGFPDPPDLGTLLPDR